MCKDLKLSIDSLFKSKVGIKIYFLLKTKDGYKTKLANFKYGDAEVTVLEATRTYLNERILENPAFRQLKLSEDEDVKGAIYEYDFPTYPPELSAIKSFKDETVPFDLDSAEGQKLFFNSDNDDLKNLSGFIVVIGNETNQITLFKKHYSVSLIKGTSDGWFSNKADKFTSFNEGNLIYINRNVDLILYEGTMYVLNLPMIERTMGFTDIIKKHAEDAVDWIDKRDIVDNIELIRESIDNVTFARKLARVMKKSPVVTKNIGNAELIKFTQDESELTGRFKYTDDGSQFKIRTIKAKEDFIKLLNDEFLHSKLTHLSYEASSKHVLNNIS